MLLTGAEFRVANAVPLVLTISWLSPLSAAVCAGIACATVETRLLDGCVKDRSMPPALECGKFMVALETNKVDHTPIKWLRWLSLGVWKSRVSQIPTQGQILNTAIRWQCHWYCQKQTRVLEPDRCQTI
jgi:hypothetical protein